MTAVLQMIESTLLSAKTHIITKLVACYTALKGSFVAVLRPDRLSCDASNVMITAIGETECVRMSPMLRFVCNFCTIRNNAIEM